MKKETLKTELTEMTENEVISDNFLDKIQDEFDFFCLISTTVLINRYIYEDVSMGYAKPGEEIPFDRYVKDLEIENYRPYKIKDLIDGPAIDENFMISDHLKDYYYRKFYCSSMNYVFWKVPKFQREFDADDIDSVIDPFKFGFKEFLEAIYPIFCSILDTKVTYEFFDLVPCFSTRESYVHYCEKAIKFLAALKLKGLRQGSTVDRYVKDLPYLNVYLNRLVEKKGKHYVLVNSDTNSLDYKLALLTSMPYMKQENSKLFELKARVWEVDKFTRLTYRL